MLQPNEIFDGTYQVIQEIGRGGTGIIYLAYHLRLQKYVVLKRLQTYQVSEAILRRETDLLKNLHHPSLPQIYDFISREGEVYTVMDYIEGQDLGHIPCGPGRISEQQLLRWFRQLAQVLEYLHSRKRPILHSDIKPENIILMNDGSLCLIDFNISLDGQSSKISGFSREYASPEQMQLAETILAGQQPAFELDVRTDIYSLGATFYYLLMGTAPVNRGSVSLENVTGLPYSPGLLSVVSKCMAWNRERRYPSAKKLLSALDDLKKQDVRYRKYLGLQAASWLCAAGLALGGIFCLVQGNRVTARENCGKEYTRFCQAIEMESSETALERGLKLLNAPQYKPVLENDPEKKAAVLHAIGDIYRDEQNSEGALRYYGEAVFAASEDDENLGAYYLDYGAALAEAGKADEAEEILKTAETKHIDAGAALLIRADLHYRRGEGAAALELVDRLMAGSADDRQKARACTIAANVLGTRTPEGIAWLEKARQYDPGVRLLRLLAASYLDAGQQQRKSEYCRQARDCYTELCARNSPGLEDRIGLAVSEFALERYEECIKLLRSYSKAGETSCRIDMYLAFAYHNAGDDVQAADWCRKADRKLKEMPASQKQALDENELETLRQLREILGL